MDRPAVQDVQLQVQHWRPISQWPAEATRREAPVRDEQPEAAGQHGEGADPKRQGGQQPPDWMS